MRGNILIVFSLLLLFIAQTFGNDAFANAAAEAEAPYFKDDLKYLKCDLCRRITEQVYDGLQEVKVKAMTDKQVFVDEMAVAELLEMVCNPEHPKGLWITQQDIQVRGRNLKLIDQEERGMCNKECHTIEKGCQAFAEEYGLDLDQVGKIKRPEKQKEQIVNEFCEADLNHCPQQRRMSKKQAKVRSTTNEKFEGFNAEKYNQQKTLSTNQNIISMLEDREKEDL